MTPQQLHEACITAAAQCPQYHPWRFDAPPFGVKYDTLAQVASYWLKDETLWRKGYCCELGRSTIEFFLGLRHAVKDAVVEYCKNKSSIDS